jgi:molecular chaperone GrpE (heat shock protein)
VSDNDTLKEIFLGLVETLDAFERLEKAAAEASPSPETQRWIERFMLVKKRVENVLAQQRVQRAGFDTFNEELHEVVDIVASEEHAENAIVEVQEPCYTWFPDGVMRALRKARVVVAITPQKQKGS